METPLVFAQPEVARLFTPEAHIRRILDFEAALARAEAAAGVIPRAASDAIGAACGTLPIDAAALYREAAVAGTVVIPLVRALVSHVAPAGRAFVHWGATSQDAIDSAAMLQAREALGLLREQADAIAVTCARLAETHRHTVMPGRTLLQQATPVTFGLKAARWLSLAVRQAAALAAARRTGLALQFGGATGTLASLGTAGAAVAARLAEDLQLPCPDLPWHAERDRVGRLAADVGVAAAAFAKIALDIVLLAQSEVGEVAEGVAPGKGTSSAMPHKRNPVDATAALAATRLCTGAVSVVLAALPQELERAAGGWQAEWRAVPDVFVHGSGVLWHVRAAVAGLEIDAPRMRAHLDTHGGVLMAEPLALALAPHLGRTEAHALVQRLAAQAIAAGTSLQAAALADGGVTHHLTPAAIAAALDPAGYLGSTSTFIDQALDAYRRASAGESPA